jgi:hypothetical protein
LFIIVSSRAVFEVQALMKKFKANRVDSSNGEIHFILEELQPTEHSDYLEIINLAEIKRISRKEAAKPLILFREE